MLVFPLDWFYTYLEKKGGVVIRRWGDNNAGYLYSISVRVDIKWNRERHVRDICCWASIAGCEKFNVWCRGTRCIFLKRNEKVYEVKMRPGLPENLFKTEIDY